VALNVILIILKAAWLFFYLISKMQIFTGLRVTIYRNRSQVPGSPFPVIVVFRIFINLLLTALNSGASI